VRLMSKVDISQVSEIDREAFPALWPPANYRRELENQLAHYIVAGDNERVQEPEIEAIPPKGFSGLVFRLRHLFSNDHFYDNELSTTGGQYIFGFAGFWIMAGRPT